MCITLKLLTSCDNDDNDDDDYEDDDYEDDDDEDDDGCWSQQKVIN